VGNRAPPLMLGVMPTNHKAMNRVHYDEVAHLYDEPERDHGVDQNLLAFLQAKDGPLTSAVRILDVGCGTGKQLAANRRRFPDMVMVGLDRFGGMLRIAQRRCPEAVWLLADGARLPFSSEAFHYIINQFAYPHVRRTRQLVTEVFRTLKPGGRFVMTNIDPWSMVEWLIYQYFPEALELDRQDFLQVEPFVALMRDVGFQDVEVMRDDLSRQESVTEFLNFAAKRHRASQLMAISDDAYAAGIRRVQDALATDRDRDLVVRSEFVLVTIVGNKASGQPAA
jgi:ubiquinone/menaquinone biosynthesis C-methylase UbiE